MHPSRLNETAGQGSTAASSQEMRELSYAQAINVALAEEMERDERIILLGEDIGAYGGVFRVTQGLQERFGTHRVLDTPISEAGFLGCAVGAAMCGLRPVVEIMYVDFTGVAMDQIINQAAKLAYVSGGQVRVPLVIRTQQGARPGAAAQHAQCFEAIFAHIPGLRVVTPATPRDARGLLKAAIRCDDPVVFLEHKLLYSTTGLVPLAEEVIPLGRASLVRSGKDVSLFSYAAMLPVVMEAADRLAEMGVSAEVVDVRSLAPLDEETLLSSIRRTNRALIVHEAWRRGGLGAEIAALLQERAFDYLDAPVARVAACDVPKPFSPAFDAFYLPTVEKVVQAVLTLLR
nr:alpha-ketoacid dehydrogenase subunit beta [Thermogemmatispora carboxidivorans]